MMKRPERRLLVVQPSECRKEVSRAEQTLDVGREPLSLVEAVKRREEVDGTMEKRTYV